MRLFILFLALTICGSRPLSAQEQTPRNEPALLTVPAQWAAARVSMSLQPMLLHETLDFIKLAHGLNFSYGSLPDVVVKINFEDAPLLPALQELLNGTGFEMRLVTEPNATEADSATRLWIFRRAGALLEPASGIYSVAWTPQKPPAPVEANTLEQSSAEQNARQNAEMNWMIWSRAFAPPAGWHLPSPSDGVLGAEIGEFAHSAAGWNATLLRPSESFSAPNGPVEKSRVASGFALDTATVAVMPSGNEDATMRETYLRWTMTLRTVPRGAQLLLVLPRPATFTINGAPLIRREAGVLRLDLSRLLKMGENNLSLHFESVPPKDEPVLRYAWILPDRMNDKPEQRGK